MKCPICNVDLAMTVRQDVEIDYCPQCRGVWLDRGELDKIIDRTVPTNVPRPGIITGQQNEYREYDDDHHDRHDHHDDHNKGYNGNYKHKKKSLLHDLFDF